jgi:glutathione peroxidase
MQHDILNTEVTTIDGEKTTLASFAGKVLLIVNVASKCGLTPQYEQLEDLQKQFAAEGFSVLGFPCNQFLGQEPGSEEEIKTFCSTTYGVTFPLFSKIDVNGEHRAPLYQKLIAAAPKAVAPEGSGFYERMASKGRAPLYVDDILWNFEKFLVDRQGNVIQRFSPDMTPIRSWWRRLKERWRNNVVSDAATGCRSGGAPGPVFCGLSRRGDCPSGGAERRREEHAADPHGGAVRRPRHGSF